MKVLFQSGLCIVMLLLTSCRQGEVRKYINDRAQQVVEEYHKNNRLKSKIIYLNDSLTDYQYCSYYADGQLRDSALYLNNLLHGVRKSYERSNKLMHYETYSYGVLHGEHKALFDNGVSSFVGYRLNGYKVGEWLFHYKDGRLITYEYYDSTGVIRFFRKYDEKERMLKQTGNAIIAVYTDSDTVAEDAILSGYLHLAYPPGYIVNIRIGEAVTNDLRNDTTMLVEDHFFPFAYRVRSVGAHSIGFVMEMEDDNPRNRSVFSRTIPAYNPGSP